MERKLRVGVIGCGAIAQEAHLPGYAACEQAKVTAVCDIDEARARETATRFGVPKVYLSHLELLRDPDVDAVSICTPNNLHATQMIDALRAGKAVLGEKPMTTTREDARAVLAAAEATGSLLMVGFTHRFILGNRYMKRLMAAGEIGQINSIRVRMAHRGPYDSWVAKSDWFFRHEMAGGGAVLDMGIHALDILRYLGGEVAEVMGMTATRVHPIVDEDMAVMVARFDSGALGYVETGWHSRPGFNGIEVYGTEGSMVHDYRVGLRVRNAKGEEQPLNQAELTGPGGHNLEIQHFVDCALGGRQPEVGGLDGLKAIDLALRVYGK